MKHLPKKELVDFYQNKLAEKAEMLNDFFGLEIEDGHLVRLPVIVPAIKPYP